MPATKSASIGFQDEKTGEFCNDIEQMVSELESWNEWPWSNKEGAIQLKQESIESLKKAWMAMDLYNGMVREWYSADLSKLPEFLED